MSDGSGDQEPAHIFFLDEGPDEVSDTESSGRDSDLASVVLSEVSTESVEEPVTWVGAAGWFPPPKSSRDVPM